MINPEGIVLITDDPVMAAIVSSGFVAPGQYFPVFESPRMMRPDADREIITLVNAIRRIRAKYIVYGKIDKSISSKIAEYLDLPFNHLDNLEELSEYTSKAKSII